jgi:hypothetical protein
MTQQLIKYVLRRHYKRVSLATRHGHGKLVGDRSET